MSKLRTRLFGARKKKQIKEHSNFRLQIFVGIGLFATISLLIWGTWQITRLPSLTIREVTVVGGQTISHEHIRSLVEEELAGTYLRVIPHRFSYTYPHDAIEERILGIDRIRQVYVERSTRTTLGVAFEEYEPIALWCGENMLTDECMFLDREGYAFAPAPPMEGASFIRYSERGRVPTKGEYLFDGEYLMTTNTFIQNAYDILNLNIVYVERTAEDEVTYELSGGGTIKTSLTMSTEATLTNLETILFSKEFDHIAPGNFNYIDLRFGNKVFVNEVVDSDSATTTESIASSTAEVESEE